MTIYRRICLKIFGKRIAECPVGMIVRMFKKKPGWKLCSHLRKILGKYIKYVRNMWKFFSKTSIEILGGISEVSLARIS